MILKTFSNNSNNKYNVDNTNYDMIKFSASSFGEEYLR